jgi:hypothetical protein
MSVMNQYVTTPSKLDGYLPPATWGDMVASPTSTNYSLIGTAFDYLMRFGIERECDNVITRPWVAWLGMHFANGVFDFDDASTIQKKVSNAENIYTDFIRKVVEVEDIVQACLDLANIDTLYRTGRALPIDEMFNYVDAYGDDLIRLYDAIPMDVFKGRHNIMLNPIFGDGSALVGGADADIIVDGCIIDIKTTKIPGVSSSAIKQLAGYYVLASISGIAIDRLGIYSSRFGRLLSYNAEDVVDNIGVDAIYNVFNNVDDDRKKRMASSRSVQPIKHLGELEKQISPRTHNQKAQAYASTVRANPNVTGLEVYNRYKNTRMEMEKNVVVKVVDSLKRFYRDYDSGQVMTNEGKKMYVLARQGAYPTTCTNL